jgi:microcystin-dependent protein
MIPNRIPHLWWGTVEEIPEGWLLCDGTNGTPDLRNRFVIGASETNLVGSVGGTLTHAHGATIEQNGSHAHGVEIQDTVLDITQIPSHRHLNGVTDDSATQNPFNRGFSPANPPGARGMDDVSSAGIHEGRTESVGGGQGHSHGATSQDAGNHTHGAEITSQTHLPPYMALHYIIRL